MTTSYFAQAEAASLLMHELERKILTLPGVYVRFGAMYVPDSQLAVAERLSKEWYELSTLEVNLTRNPQPADQTKKCSSPYCSQPGSLSAANCAPACSEAEDPICPCSCHDAAKKAAIERAVTQAKKQKETRPSYDEYFTQIAKAVSVRGTCLRLKVGALIVNGKHLLSTGYNGALPGQPHCIDEGVGCQMEHGHCVRTTHAEMNALLQAAKYGVRTEGCTLYTTAAPCPPCFRAAVSAGIQRIVYSETYRLSEEVVELAKKVGVELVQTQIAAILDTSN